VRGTVVDDQYRIERVLGEGGMGTVYLARDLRLDRDVALKLARDRSPQALARSTREALTLARLSHPNVVVIYQVGIHDQRLYVAMEYVKGMTARAWASERRSVREIVELYLAVGEGLAAAHAAGIVHHDFKPDNVLVGEDGRARVADFGLARTALEAEAGMRVAGTPAYMAPEQARGDAIDHRADQYAFCASLWEALHQALPSGSDQVATVSVAAIPRSEPTGATSAPLGKAAVPLPRHVEAALRRGLAPDRDDRWPSLAPLLTELRRDPTRRRRRLVLAVGAAVLAIGGVAAAVWPAREATTDPCQLGPDAIARVWSPARIATTKLALAPAGAPAWLTRATTNALGGIAAWTARWAGQYRAVCDETGWTPALRDRGFGCLSQAKHVLEGTLDNAGEHGFGAARFETAVGALPRPESCTDPAYLQALVAPPTDPVLAKQVAAVDGELSRTRQLGTAGQLDRAAQVLAQTKTTAPADPALGVRVHYTEALLARSRGDDDKAFPAMHDVYFEARALGDRVTATAAARECALALLNLSRDPEATEWAHLAEVEASFIPDVGLQIGTLAVLATVANDRDRPAQALELADKAVRLARRERTDDRLRTALATRAAALDKLGQPERALADLDEAMRIVRATSGEVHPELSALGAQATLVLVHLGRIDEALATSRKAVAIAEATAVADVMNTARSALGVALTRAHAYGDALALLDNTLALDRELDGDKGYNVASDLNNRCDLLAQLHRYPEAIASGREAIAIWSEQLGSGANEIGIAHFNIALSELAANQPKAALADAAASLAIFERRAGNPDRALALIIHGAAAGVLGQWATARKDVETAIHDLGDEPADPGRLAWARLELARVEQAAGNRGTWPSKPSGCSARRRTVTSGRPRPCSPSSGERISGLIRPEFAVPSARSALARRACCRERMLRRVPSGGIDRGDQGPRQHRHRPRSRVRRRDPDARAPRRRWAVSRRADRRHQRISNRRRGSPDLSDQPRTDAQRGAHARRRPRRVRVRASLRLRRQPAHRRVAPHVRRCGPRSHRARSPASRPAGTSRSRVHHGARVDRHGRALLDGRRGGRGVVRDRARRLTSRTRTSLVDVRIPLAAVALAACSKRATTPAAPHDADARTPLEGQASATDAQHLLNRLAFGPTPGQTDAVAKQGLTPWLERQLRPAALPDPAGVAALVPFQHALAPSDELQDAAALEAEAMLQDGEAGGDKKAKNMARRELVLATQMTAIARHVASERQLQEVMTDFWTNHFSVSLQKGKVRFLAADFVEHVVRPHAFGRFAELLLATARHPAMLVYLDNAQSVAPPPGSKQAQKGRGLNENYARELMELHTLGVAGGYTQDDVIAVARILSGWSVADGEFIFRARLHDDGAKTVMGEAFPAHGGETEGKRLLEYLATHPATIRHVCQRLCMRLVADDPPQDVVDSAIAAWLASGGEIAAVVRAIVHAPGFWRDEIRGAKIKSPLELVVSAVRAVGGEVDGDGLAKVLAKLGQPPLLAPAPTGYGDSQDAWLSTAGALERMDLALGLAAEKLPGVKLALDRVLPLPVTEPLPTWRVATLGRIDAIVQLGTPSRTVVERWLAKARQPQPARTMALALALASPEFQRQ